MADNLEVVGLEFDVRDFERAIQRAERRLDDLEGAVDRSGKAAGRAESVFDSLGRKVVGVVGAYAGFRTLQSTARYVFNTNVEFQKLEATLGTVTGSIENGQAAFGLITDFAKTTPFEVANLTQAFIALRVRGFEPSKDELKGLGNFASAFVADITDLSDAVVSATAGMSKPLKRFGIDAAVEGKQISLTFQGVTRTVENTAENVSRFLAEMGNTKFADAMADRMKTLDGAISNLKDTASVLAKEIGDAGLNAEMTALVRSTDELLGSTDGLARALGGGLATALREVGELGKEWMLILGKLGGESPAAAGIKMSLSNVSDVQTLTTRHGEFMRLLPSDQRSVQENARLLNEEGLTAADVDSILRFIEDRTAALTSGSRGTPASKASSGGGDPSKLEKQIADLNAKFLEQIVLLESGAEAALRYNLAQQGIVGAAQDEIVANAMRVESLRAEQALREGLATAAKRDQDAINRTIDALLDENMALTHGKEALLVWQMAGSGASEAQVQLALDTMRANDAIIEQREQAERAATEELRQLEKRLMEIERWSQRLGDSMTDAFVDIITGSRSAADAFSEMTRRILEDITRLAFERAVVKPLTDSVMRSFGLPERAAGGPVEAGGAYVVGEKGPELFVPRLSGDIVPNHRLQSGGGRAVVVNQSLHFNVTGMDGADVSRVLRQQKGQILQMVGEGVRESTSFRRMMGG